MQITNLRCEYAVNPLGIDETRPRFSWEVVSERRGARQTAYQIRCADSPDALQAGATIWNTQKVASDETAHIAYSGPELQSGQRVYWSVETWDENDAASEASETAFFEMGLLNREDWKAEWIGANLVGSPFAAVPCPYLRRSFAIDKPVAAARLYVTALGLYEMSCNGQRVGEDIFTPGWTDYSKRIAYQVYDMAAHLMQGENVLGAILGDGWYCGYVGMQSRQTYGDRPKLLAQLHLRYADGTEDLIVSDGSWRVGFGPITESDVMMGESYDARLELPGWNLPAYDDSAWQPARMFPDVSANLVAMRGPAVRKTQELTPIAEPKTSGSGMDAIHLFDIGQNMVGRIRLKVSGPKGATVRMRFAEVLNPDGSLYLTNLRSARCTDYYTLKGEGEEIYESRFTFHGFRYVDIKGLPAAPTKDAITGIVLHSDTPPTGEFSCSDPLVNQLQSNIQWGQRGNFLEVPTDCPQRDERLGWTGDAQVFIRTAAFNMDVASFFTKWQNDLADAQSENGAFPPVIPSVINPGDPAADGGPAWADAGIICPYTVYLCYGDKRILETHYESMSRYMTHLENDSRDFIRRHPDMNVWGGFGDWLSINAETPPDLIGTAFFAYDAHLMTEIAKILGKTDDAKRFAETFEKVKAAFNRRYVTEDGIIASGTQTACVLALHFNLLPENLRPAAVNALVKNIKDRGMKLSTGFVGSPYLNHVLTAGGRNDIAHALLFQKNWPSWLYPVTHGATTIWERWDGWTEEKGFQDPGMNSFNHYAYGAIGAWLYQTVAGIDIDPKQPAYKNFYLRPLPSDGITSAKAAFHSLRGKIESDWQMTDGVFHWRVTIPANTTATVSVPAAENAIITENSQPIENADGLQFLRREPNATVYLAQSGQYDFSVSGL